VSADEKPRPFIPGWLDDLGLPQAEFRVLCNLWRHSDKAGRCYPGSSSIMRRCRLSENTLWKTLNSLECRGLIARDKGKRNSNIYQLSVPTDTANETVTQAIELPQKEQQQLPQTEREQFPQKERLELPQKERYKGIPYKDIQLRESSEGVEPNTHTPQLPAALSEDEVTAFAEATGATRAEVCAAFSAKIDRERKFGGAWDERAQAALRDDLREIAKNRTSNPRHYSNTPDYSGIESFGIDAFLEPEDWRTKLPEDDEDLITHGKYSWGSILPFYQRRIIEKLRSKP
jgi:DNA-binding MarR family transcriptional regulator